MQERSIRRDLYGHAGSSGPSFFLSIVMPTYNEGRTLSRAIREVLDLQLPCQWELIVVDDGSTDQTPVILRNINDQRVTVHTHPANLGKGAAVLSGAALASGSHLVVFDADAEYQARDLFPMVQAVMSSRAMVVFGTRLFGMNSVYQSFSHAMGNKLATLAANLLFNSYLSDMHTCLKMVPVPLFRDLQLSSKGFGLDTELTGELLRRGYRPYEIPISYVSRSRLEGKKLSWVDGLDCLFVLLKVRMRGRLQREHSTAPSEMIDLIEIDKPEPAKVTAMVKPATPEVAVRA